MAAYFSAALAAKVIILVLENQSKRSILIKDWQTYGREETSGLMNRGFLFWINDFLIKGHKSFLTPADMYALSGDLRSRPLLDRMRRDWRRHKGSGKNALLWNLITANKFSILLGAIPRTALALIKLAQPFLITRILTYMQLQGTDAAEPKDAGYAIIVAVALFSVLDPVSSIRPIPARKIANIPVGHSKFLRPVRSSHNSHSPWRPYINCAPLCHRS